MVLGEILQTLLRIEAVELPKTAGMFSLPLRVGFRTGGHVRAYLEQDAVRLRLNASSGPQTHFIAIAKTRRANGKSDACLVCPNCSKRRKRLFLAESRVRRRNASYVWRCYQCLLLRYAKERIRFAGRTGTSGGQIKKARTTL